MPRALRLLEQRLRQHHPDRALRRWGAAIATVVAVAAATGCGGSERSPERPTRDLGPARAFEELRLFHVGERFAGLALTDDGSDRLRDWRPRRPVTFGYGFCTDRGEGGCVPPLAISNLASCADNLTRRGGAAAPDRVLRLRGVRAGVFGDGLMLTTGTTTVRIQARSADEALAAARALRSADGRIAPGARLPPPDPRWLGRGCRHWRRGGAPGP